MNLGAPEILLLAVFALIFFGPKRLPEIGRQIGRAMAEIRRVGRQFEDEVREATEPFQKEIAEAEREVRDAYALDEDHSRYLVKPTGPPDKPQETNPTREPGEPARD